ncbi:ribosomal protein S18-alanine N-acetyltransferase [Marinobacter sp. X15-166B]|uniref:ribosomal protein S18-alanine N-acetyltransferase n=1 Tax=Marinobacter sp. X15-166B TaxID=1897620 RepID=UPI00085C7CF5|nr:ribosomal protein S18-alanine N-acetyltransferase [Marinobacter sp. X15-166B]OEY66673.1 ribosomal-protein-alanine N-acetyltransferase [Marinobacter sp. X15-166B]
MAPPNADQSWSIQPLTEQDLPAMLTVERQAHSHPWSEGIFRDCLRSGYRFAGIADHRGLRAFCVVTNQFDEAHLVNICVSPECQGQGLGRQLLAYLIKRAKNDGMERLLLEVRRSNKKALRLYRSAGFERIGVRRGYYPSAQGREDAVVLSLFLL